MIFRNVNNGKMEVKKGYTLARDKLDPSSNPNWEFLVLRSDDNVYLSVVGKVHKVDPNYGNEDGELEYNTPGVDLEKLNVDLQYAHVACQVLGGMFDCLLFFLMYYFQLNQQNSGSATSRTTKSSRPTTVRLFPSLAKTFSLFRVWAPIQEPSSCCQSKLKVCLDLIVFFVY